MTWHAFRVRVDLTVDDMVLRLDCWGDRLVTLER